MGQITHDTNLSSHGQTLPRNHSGGRRPISVRSRSSRRLFKNATTVGALSNQSSSNKICHTWANHTYETSKQIKVLRQEYHNPIDNLASLKSTFIPQIPQAKLNNSTKELIDIVDGAQTKFPRHKSTGKVRRVVGKRGHKTLRQHKATHSFVVDPIM